jgi:hypothetical protein
LGIRSILKTGRTKVIGRTEKSRCWEEKVSKYGEGFRFPNTKQCHHLKNIYIKPCVNTLIGRQVNIAMASQKELSSTSKRAQHRTRHNPEASVSIWKLNLHCINKTS